MGSIDHQPASARTEPKLGLPSDTHGISVPLPLSLSLLLCLFIVVGAFVVRLTGIVEPLGPDQGVYATIGWGMQRGLALYRDLWEQKPPGIYLMYQLAFALFGTGVNAIFWIDYLAAALTTLVLFDLGRRVVSLRFGALTAAVFAIGTLPAARFPYGGFIERAISEDFIVLLVSAAAWATAMAIAPAERAWPTAWPHAWSVGAGLLLGLTTVFKPMAAVYWLALVLWTWWVTDRTRAWRFAIDSAFGSLVAPLLAIGWMWSQGVLQDAWIALAEYNRAYLAIGGYSFAGIVNELAHEVWRRLVRDEMWALGALSAGVAFCAWRWRGTKPGAAAALGIVWLGASLASILLNGPRMFHTYFLPPLVPLSLLFAWLLDQIIALPRGRRAVGAVLVLGFTAIMLVRSGSVARAISVTTWDTERLRGHIDRQEFLQHFRSRYTQSFSAADNAQLADYIRSHSEPQDRIFIFGMSAGTYFLSGRLPASRFLWAYPAVSRMIDRPEFRVETLASDLARKAPRYIVFQRHNGDNLSGWRAEDSFAAPPMVALLRGYRQEVEIGGFVLYRRI
jgi:hypothetical protein